MPHIQINKNEFEELLGKKISDEKIREEADFLGVHWTQVEDEKWDVEVYPDRPDLLSVEGLARAYKGYWNIDTGLEELEVGSSGINVNVEESVEDVRPHIACAVVKDVSLDDRALNGMIQLQEKLHVSYGRKRDKIAIGLHDPSDVEPPFTYRAADPGEVSFTPLDSDLELDLGEILEKHEKGQEYGWILEEAESYPLIVDSNDQVLSFPPIINNSLTEVTTDTETVFIDVTGKDRETVEKTLNILVYAFHERGAEIESVKVDGEAFPDLEPAEMGIDADYVNRITGLDLESEELENRLEEMRLGFNDGKALIPAYRTDVMHKFDLVEDAVISHGYRNVEPVKPVVDTEGELSAETGIQNQVREIMRNIGGVEAYTNVLTSEEALNERMNADVESVELANPMTETHSTPRSWLTPSLMAVLEENRHNEYPQRFFEAAETVDEDGSNRLKLCYLASGEYDYNHAREALEALAEDLDADLNLKKSSRPFHKASRSAVVELNGVEAGFIGEFSEEVRKEWGVKKPVTGFEIFLDPLK